MIAIIDYGAGNLFSVKNALDFLQKESTITEDVQEIRKADAMILPGVGAFPDAMRMLKEKGLDKVICEEAQRKPLLGICLGMQMLFETSYEFKETKGLGLLEGSVVPIDGGGLKIPHMGWNNLTILNLMCILYIPSVQRQRTKIFPAIRCTMRKFRHLCIKDLYMERSSIRKKAVRWDWDYSKDLLI